MRKEDIRKAFADLAIHKPLKLRPPSGPAVSKDKKPSQDMDRSVEPTKSTDQNEIKDAEVSPDFLGSGDTHSPVDAKRSLDQKASSDTPKSQVRKTSRDLESAKDQNRPESSVASKDKKEPGVGSASEDQIESLDRNLPEFIERGSSNPRRATIQDQAVIQITSLKGELTNGYTRVPNSLLMEMVKGELSRSEMKILLLVARLTISFNRDMAPISKAVLERLTGVQGRKALAAVADLEAKGLLRKQKGDQMRPNELGLSAKVTWDKNQSEGTSGPDPKDPKRSKGWDPNGPHFKDKKENKDKISLSELPENLKKYFSGLIPEAKRESEIASLEILKRDFSTDQIELVFSHLQEQQRTGALDCHSPMSFLKKAIADLLPAATAARETLVLRQRNEAEALHAAQIQSERDSAEAEEFDRKERAFREAFRTEAERKSAFEQFAPENRYFTPGSRPFEMQVISNWFQLNKGGNL